MNTTFTNYAEKKAKQFLNLLQGYTKGIRITAILILLVMGVGSVNAETMMRVYCKQAQSWWKADGAAVGVYAWKNSNTNQKNANYPGVRMSPVDGQADLWYADIDIDKYDRIIFTRVNASGTIADWGAKTGRLCGTANAVGDR